MKKVKDIDVHIIEHDRDVFDKLKTDIQLVFPRLEVISSNPHQVLSSISTIASSSLLLIDMDYPGLNVNEMVENLSRETRARIVVIGNSEGGPARFEKALRLGACDYIIKPIIDSRVISIAVSHLKGAILCSSGFYS